MSVTIASSKLGGGGTGCQAYLWAFDDGSGSNYVPDVTKLTVQTFDEEHTPEFESTATDDEGNVGAVRRGPTKITFNVVGYAESGAKLTTYLNSNGGATNCKLDITSHLIKNTKLTCQVTSWKITRANNDFAKVDLTAESYFRLRNGSNVCCPT